MTLLPVIDAISGWRLAPMRRLRRGGGRKR